MKNYRIHTYHIIYDVSVEIELDDESEISYEDVSRKLSVLKEEWNFKKEAEGVYYWWTTSEGEFYSEPRTYWDPGYEEEDIEFTREELYEVIKDIKSYSNVGYVSVSFEEKRDMLHD